VSVDDGRRRAGFLAAVLVGLVCVLALPPVASAELYVVNSTADEVDETPGNEVCATAQSECTLRAAIEEANESEGEFDEIAFEEPPFEGGVDGTIALTESLPSIADSGRINGRECPTDAGVSGPCVGIEAPSAEPALVVEANEVEIEGLAVTGAQVGIAIEGAEFVKVRGSWLGVGLDGSVDGNETGIFVDPESSSARIGGEGPGAGDLFAGSTAEGLDVLGASNVRILGNYFGVEPDGATPAANGVDLEVTSTSSGEFEATGTAIGTRVSASAAESAKCDGGCNLISGSESNGIDLQGDDPSEAPAVETTIAGNYVGLDATGDAPVPNAGAGIHVGEADQTVIGGPKAGEANRINGGSAGVLAGPAAADLVLRGNSIGLDASGEDTLDPPEDGIVVDSEGLVSAAVEAAIVDNEIRMEGGVAISQTGFGARIAGNLTIEAQIGIRVSGVTAEHGNLIESNWVGGSEVNGILVESNSNEILGNAVAASGAAGIKVQGSPPFGVTENRIGGDESDEENKVNLGGGPAIEIVDVEATANEVARNRGIANVGLFIDLVAASPGTEPKGPNFGIQPPVFTAVTATSAAGEGAEPGATVRLFRKLLGSPGEIESFLGEATADGEGNWNVSWLIPIPGETDVAATQTSEAGATSELAFAKTSGGSEGDGGNGGGGGSNGGGGGGGAGAPGGSSDKPPQTKLLAGPKRKSHSRTAKFKFSSSEPGSTFQCKLDGKPFKACGSPKTYKHLKPGKHVFKVRAVDSAGSADPQPAKRKFTVLG
jgi:CSLREA domain-containing protein